MGGKLISRGEPGANPKAKLIDRRQEIAAALILTAFDLPADGLAVAKQIARAAKAAPGLFMSEITPGQRVASLLRARELIDALLAPTQAGSK